MRKFIPRLLLAIPPVSFLVLLKWNTAVYAILDTLPLMFMIPYMGGLMILWFLLIFFKHLFKTF